MKVNLKEKDKLYLQKIDINYLKLVEDERLFTSYQEILEDKKDDDFVLVEGKDLIDMIHTHDEIIDYVSFLMMSKKDVKDEMEYWEFCKSQNRKQENAIFYEFMDKMAMLNYQEKDLREEKSFLPIIESLIDVSYVHFTNHLVTYGTKVEGLYVTKKIDNGSINLFDQKMKEELDQQLFSCLNKESTNPKEHFQVKEIHNNCDRSIYHVIKSMKAKTYRK